MLILVQYLHFFHFMFNGVNSKYFFLWFVYHKIKKKTLKLSHTVFSVISMCVKRFVILIKFFFSDIQIVCNFLI